MATYYCKNCEKMFHLKVKKTTEFKCTKCNSDKIKYIGNCRECLDFIAIDGYSGTCSYKDKININTNGCKWLV